MTLLAGGAQAVARRRHKHGLRRLAAAHHMHYLPHDPFRLAAKVARDFPIPGAADVHVSDLIYGLEDKRHRYVFTAEYTLGTVRSRVRRRRAVTFCEPASRGETTRLCLQLAPPDQPILQQYRQLLTSMRDPASLSASAVTRTG